MLDFSPLCVFKELQTNNLWLPNPNPLPTFNTKYSLCKTNKERIKERPKLKVCRTEGDRKGRSRMESKVEFIPELQLEERMAALEVGKLLPKIGTWASLTLVMVMVTRSPSSSRRGMI